jgi:YD repeat-containing protein
MSIGCQAAACGRKSSIYSFDAAKRLTGVIEAGHPVAQIGYDTAGRRSSLGAWGSTRSRRRPGTSTTTWGGFRA